MQVQPYKSILNLITETVISYDAELYAKFMRLCSAPCMGTGVKPFAVNRQTSTPKLLSLVDSNHEGFYTGEEQMEEM